MKTIILTLTILFSLSTLAHQGHSHDRPSVHGMLVTGSSKIYLSHLPMFHSPHDYQVIFYAEFDEATQKVYNQHLKSSAETVYTLVPETFVLPDMVKNNRPFKAQLFKGHFERGGELIADKVKVDVHPIYFRKFDPKAQQPELAKYILFGDANEMFLAHFITTKPDHDQIVQVTPTPELQSALGHFATIELMATEQKNSVPLNVGDNIQVTSENENLNVTVEFNIYLETGDLSF